MFDISKLACADGAWTRTPVDRNCSQCTGTKHGNLSIFEHNQVSDQHACWYSRAHTLSIVWPVRVNDENTAVNGDIYAVYKFLKCVDGCTSMSHVVKPSIWELRPIYTNTTHCGIDGKKNWVYIVCAQQWLTTPNPMKNQNRTRFSVVVESCPVPIFEEIAFGAITISTLQASDTKSDVLANIYSPGWTSTRWCKESVWKGGKITQRYRVFGSHEHRRNNLRFWSSKIWLAA